MGNKCPKQLELSGELRSCKSRNDYIKVILKIIELRKIIKSSNIQEDNIWIDNIFDGHYIKFGELYLENCVNEKEKYSQLNNVFDNFEDLHNNYCDCVVYDEYINYCLEYNNIKHETGKNKILHIPGCKNSDISNDKICYSNLFKFLRACVRLYREGKHELIKIKNIKNTGINTNIKENELYNYTKDIIKFFGVMMYQFIIWFIESNNRTYILYTDENLNYTKKRYENYNINISYLDNKS